ncbi:glycoside hydrolase [Dichomitus squalens]|nr:glycoside hydrolase [Dichomitus squalens]
MSTNASLSLSYWGQNSYGATHTDTANFQKNLSYYCQDETIDAIPLAFLNVFFSTGNLPSLDLSNICNVVDDAVFSGTNLPDCSFMAADIQACQAAGKIVTLSLGGATGGAGFSSADEATSFGDTIWNLFLGGSNDTRPFGDAVLDGIDLDIEGGSTQYFDSFVNRIRSLASSASKQYYVTGAPQCPYPDAYMSTVLNAVAFDAVYVQFYNNYCGLPNFNDSNSWDFSSWDDWAKNTAVNKDVKIYIGAPASSTAANSGYVDASTLANIALETRSQYSSFGGVMLWDASQAYVNGRFDQAVKNAIRESDSTISSSASATSASKVSGTARVASAKFTTAATVDSCADIPAWVANVAYNSAQNVIHNGHLFTAKTLTAGSTPGSASSDWTDNGVCASYNAPIPTQTSAAQSALSPARSPTR